MGSRPQGKLLCCPNNYLLFISQKRKLLKQADSSGLKLYWSQRLHILNRKDISAATRTQASGTPLLSKGLLYWITESRLDFDHSFLNNTAKQHSNLLSPISEHIHLLKIQERDLSYTFQFTPCQVKRGTARSKAVGFHQVFNSTNAAAGMKLQTEPQVTSTCYKWHKPHEPCPQTQ